MPRHRVFLLVLLSFIVGVALESLIDTPLVASGAFFVLGMVFILVGRPARALVVGLAPTPNEDNTHSFDRRRRPVLVLVWGLALAGLGIGALRMGMVENTTQDAPTAALLGLSAENRIPVRLDGVIVSFPERELDERVFVLETRAGQRFFVHAEPKSIVRYGDGVRLTGRIRQAPPYLRGEALDYEMVRAGIETITPARAFSFWRLLDGLRRTFSSTLSQLLPEPLNAYASALLLGNRAGLSAELVEIFKRVGTTHIVALSGFNITMVAKFFEVSLLAFGFSRRSSFWPALGGIVFFVLLTGASASVVRAGVMGVLVLIAFREGRRYHMTNALVLAAALMIFFEPWILRWDIGFQLSVAATAGMIFLGRYLTERLKRVPNPWHLRDAFVATIAAQCAVLPLLIYHFGEVSLISPVVNVLVIPVLPAVMILGFLALGVGLVLVPLAKVVILPVAALLSYQLWVMGVFAKLPFAKTFFPSVSFSVLLLFYGVLGVGFLLLGYSERKKRYAAALQIPAATPL